MNIIQKSYKWSGYLQKRNKTDVIVWHHAAAEKCSPDDIHRIHLMNGWAGIGYHFYIRRDGTIYQGRPIDTVGAHTSGYNSQCLGVCCEGNFEKQEMTPEQLKSAQWLKDYLSGMYPKALHKRHKDLNATACPGRYFPFEEIKKGVQEMTLEKAIEIVKTKAGLEQQTIDFMLCYKYGEELITKLAKAMEG